MSHVTSEPTAEVPADSSPPPAPPPAPQSWSRWVAVLALAVALIATALAGWSLLRPAKAGTAAPVTDQQIADAKARACTASNTVGIAVSLQTHADLGKDPVAVQAVAANARLSMAAGGPYLLGQLNPATPPPLAAAIRSFADNLQEIAMNTLAGRPNDDPAQAGRLRDAQAASALIAELCK
jgi:hypothetical protein